MPYRKPEYYPEERAEVELLYAGPIAESIERLSGEEVRWDKESERQVARLTVEPGGIRIVEVMCKAS